MQMMSPPTIMGPLPLFVSPSTLHLYTHTHTHTHTEPWAFRKEEACPAPTFKFMSPYYP
jgi:hypothetical protein